MSTKGREISKRQLFSIWKNISEDPFPKVKAFQVQAKDFNSLLKTQKCLDNEIREVEEWGRLLSVKGTDACVFTAERPDDVGYIILIRSNPYHTLREILEHELSHIAMGDL
jgi:hypothetical protein